MIFDSPSQVPALAYDVCIIGSGPAGITLANELVRSGGGKLSICVLESGSRGTTPYADGLRDVDSEGIEIKSYSRERILGGASTTWAGLSSLLDEIDFAQRAWVPYSGWPLRFDQLQPYYDRAAAHYRFPDAALFSLDKWTQIKEAGDIQLQWKDLSEKIFLAAKTPQRFGTEFIDLFNSANANLILDSTVVRLDGHKESGKAEVAEIRSSDGHSFTIRARYFVLACGGIENARLLLLSTYACPNGLGNEYDQVGRYLMNHPKENVGVIHLTRPLKEMPAYFGFMYRKFRGAIGLRLNESFQEEHKLLNSYIRFVPIFNWSESRGVESAVFFIKKLAFLLRWFSHAKRDQIVGLQDYSETGDDSEIMNARKKLQDYLTLAGYMWTDRNKVWQYLSHRLRDRKKPVTSSIMIRNFMEMQPDPNNRVTLGRRLDVHGNRLPMVRHDVGPCDKRSIRVLHEVLRREIQNAGWGTFDSTITDTTDPWPIRLDASHHMGTTRMGVDPARSVVDSDGRVHSTPNVYVAGASTFPTSGNANPTYTIVAMAIRLADHLLGAGARL